MSFRIALRTGLVPVISLSLLCPILAAHPPRQQPSAPEATPLSPGAPVEREMKGGETHAYTLELRANELVEVVVDQRGVDVVVTVLDSDGKKVVTVDSPNGDKGPEVVRFPTERDGAYRIEVRALDEKGGPGRYEVRLADRRVATERERDLFEASTLLDRARVYSQRGMVKQGLSAVDRALELREKHLGPDHPDVAAALYRRGDILLLDDDVEGSEPPLRRALAIYEKVFGPEHVDSVLVLQLLSAIEWHHGRDVEAEALLQRAIDIAAKSNRPGFDIIAKEQLAGFRYERRDYAQALALRHEVLAMRQKLLGPDHPDVALSYSNIGGTYVNMGDFEGGERMFRRALEVAEKSLDPNHPFVATLLNNIAMTCQLQGKLTEAESLLLRALAINEKAKGPESRDVVYQLNNLGKNALRRGDLDKAEAFLQRGLAIVEKTKWTDDSTLVTLLSNLSGVAAERGDVERAEALTRREMAIYDRKGSTSDFVVGAATRLAQFAWRKGDAEQALALFERADEVRELNINRKLTVGSERQRRGYVASLADDSVLAFAASEGAGSPRAARLALSVVLRRKGRSLDETADILGKLRRDTSPEDRALLDELAELRVRLSGLALERLRSGDSAGSRDEAAKLAERADEAEARLGLRDPRLHAQALPVTIERVRAAVPADTALVEIVRFDAGEPWKRAPTHHYAAIVVRHDGDPAFVDLGPAGPIDDEVAAFRRVAANPALDATGASRRLDERLLRPVRERLRGAKRLLISPDGALNLVPFAALADESNRLLIERYEISYLTSGRDLLRLDERAESAQPALILANPSFQAAAVAAAATAPDPERTRAVDLANPSFLPLPGTEEEARAVARLIPGSVLLTGERATKAAVERARAPRILHVATHGYFISDASAPNAPRIEDPLLRSGLALAGANRREGGRADGLLTALEVAGLDLWGTQIVVLSACDTGVGDVRVGEGVYGLRRALVLAGSETQVLSLWDVDDLATRDLMAGYYRALLAGKGRAEAMRDVQLKMLSGGRRRHPAYWAGFIVSGDWRPLRPTPSSR